MFLHLSETTATSIRLSVILGILSSLRMTNSSILKSTTPLLPEEELEVSEQLDHQTLVADQALAHPHLLELTHLSQASPLERGTSLSHLSLSRTPMTPSP